MPPSPVGFNEGLDNRSETERQARIADIKRWLATDPDDSLIWPVADELGWLAYGLGDTDDALHAWRDIALPAATQLGDIREEAITWGLIGNIHYDRGNLDEALRIRHEHELPVYTQLGDIRAEAITWGKIGDIVEARGNLDEALRIREEHELPVYTQLGDIRSEAITNVKIGLVLLRDTASRAEAEANLRKALRTLTRVDVATAEMLASRMREHGIEPMRQPNAACATTTEAPPRTVQHGEVRGVTVRQG